MIAFRSVVRSACVDIGSNTTRLLVAEIDGDSVWREMMTQRAYTLIGKQADSSGKLPKKVIEDTAEVVSTQVRLAREMGADDITIVATAAVRGAPNKGKLSDEVLERTGIAIRVLSGNEEAQLAFIGATKRLGTPAEGTIAVIDVGGGSTELAVGTVDDGPRWDATFRVGSGMLTEAYVSSDPPKPEDLDKIDSWIKEGVLGGPQPNAADYQIAPSLRLAMSLDDLRPAIEHRPAGQLALRLLPHYRGRTPPALPTAWLEPLHTHAVPRTAAYA